ncbi:RNA 3'-terminal phosphate cyclase [uncultured Desulfuromonas sp.]|uniref:RNA 3'-terminal phosphate cyclase n=2 Tax=Desulfuromonas TaxID=890 RepID=UPI00262BA682|nr:RNA 3'-terminal phosphate cyclase [uncultured Desulfuromonas sp.]
MVEIDGSMGEGGGQVLRSALTLSLLTGRSMRIRSIRAGRRKPGLMAQHLKAVEAASVISGAKAEGVHGGSTELVFRPGNLSPGEYRFDIGTAGSTSLVLQAVLLPLALCGAPSSLAITGGTHVAWSPCFHYLSLHWMPCLRLIGLVGELTLDRAGYYPKGGGRIRARIAPLSALTPLKMKERGPLQSVHCLSAVTNLPLSVAERQSWQARTRLEGLGVDVSSEEIRLPGIGRGTLLLLLGVFAASRCCFYALGERGKSAEGVADEAVEALLGFQKTEGDVDEYLADQMLLPLALAPGLSELNTARVSRHLLTNAEVIKTFLPVHIEIDAPAGRPGLVRIEGCGLDGLRRMRRGGLPLSLR